MSARLVKNKGYEDMRKVATILDRRLEPAVKRALRKELKAKAIDPMAEKIVAAANGRHGERAAASVKAAGGSKPGITGGGAKGPLFWGSEFGGQKRSHTASYYTRSRSGRPYFVKDRAVTMQFREYKKTGYWFNPTFEKNADATMAVMGEVVSQTAQREL